MKVNKIFKYTAAALCSMVVLTGCMKDIQPQEGVITQEQLGLSEVGMDALLKGIPATIAANYTASIGEHTEFGYHSIGVHMDYAAQTITPCVTLVEGGNPYYSRFMLAQYGLGMNHNGGYTHFIWSNTYPNIKNCNDIIRTAGDDDFLREYRGIAKVYRAMMYLDLARYYEPLEAQAPELAGYTDGLKSVYGLTVPIVDENTTEEEAKNNDRATREQMFEFIFADLADALECLEGYNPVNASYPTQAVVYGLYARAYLWLGGFEESASELVPVGEAAYRKAAEYARLAIETSGAPIMSESQWCDPKTGFNSVVPSWMWASIMSTDTVLNNLYAFAAHMCPEAAYGYGPLSCPGVSKLSYERLSNTDFRKNLMVNPEFDYARFKPYTQMSEVEFMDLAPYTFFKFRPGQGERNDYMTGNAISLPLMRVEEMYFIEMQAMCHFDEATAWSKLYEFMSYRDSNYACLTQDLVDEIIFQKTIEFWGEGQVMFDMKRLDIGVDTAYEGNNYPADGRFKIEGRLPWWNLPLPQGEMSVNVGIKENNPNPSGGYKPVV